MDLKLLEEFTVLAQAPSFRQASRELDISPALLSSHMNTLEKKLGAQLMERNAHRLTLTEAGKCFLMDAREIVSEYRQLLRNLDSISDNNYRSLRIGISGFTIPGMLGPFLDTVNLRYPDIHLEIFDDSKFGIVDGLNSGQVDIFFTYCSDREQFEGIEKELLYSTKVMVLAAKNHRLGFFSSVKLKDLEGERFVLYPQTAESATRNAELELLDNCGIHYSVYEGTACPAVHYVMAPIGKGLVLCPWITQNMIPPNTTALSVEDPDFIMEMYMFYRSDCVNPYLTEFLQEFRNFSFRRNEL